MLVQGVGVFEDELHGEAFNDARETGVCGLDDDVDLFGGVPVREFL